MVGSTLGVIGSTCGYMSILSERVYTLL